MYCHSNQFAPRTHLGSSRPLAGRVLSFARQPTVTVTEDCLGCERGGGGERVRVVQKSERIIFTLTNTRISSFLQNYHYHFAKRTVSDHRHVEIPTSSSDRQYKSPVRQFRDLGSWMYNLKIISPTLNFQITWPAVIHCIIH